MKTCPKCGNAHAKPGTFCGRSCANSRVQTDEINRKRSETLRKRPHDKRFKRKLTSEEKAKMVAGWRAACKVRYENTAFDDLSYEAKRRRVKEEQDGACNRCGNTDWLNEPLVLEIDHKNGDRNDNRRENLEALCPNCHSLTPTWRGKNRRKKVSDEQLLEQLKKSPTACQALITLGLSPRGGNYNRVHRLLDEYNTRIQGVSGNITDS